MTVWAARKQRNDPCHFENKGHPQEIKRTSVWVDCKTEGPLETPPVLKRETWQALEVAQQEIRTNTLGPLNPPPSKKGEPPRNLQNKRLGGLSNERPPVKVAENEGTARKLKTSLGNGNDSPTVNKCAAKNLHLAQARFPLTDEPATSCAQNGTQDEQTQVWLVSGGVPC